MSNRKMMGGLALVNLGVMALLAMSLLSCGKGVVGGAIAELSFNNPALVARGGFDLMKKFGLIPEAHASSMAITWTNAPAYFGVKFLSAYLVAEVDPVSQNNVGEVSKIYVNPACPDDPGCTSTDQVTTLFDFVRSPDEVNAEVNGQGRVVKEGSYKYVRLDFCIGGGTDNVGFKELPGDAVTLTNSNNCGRTSVEMSPPMTLEKGDRVVISLNYSMDNTLVACGSGDVTGCNANGKSVAFPTFSPTARKF